MRLERDRVKAKNEALEEHIKVIEAAQGQGSTQQLQQGESKEDESSAAAAASATMSKKGGEKKRLKNGAHPKDSVLPAAEMHAPSVALAAQALAQSGVVDPPTSSYARFALRKTFKAHRAAISALALHPTRPLLATASDDATWKLFSLPKGELVMSGEGHKDWIAGIDFHPRGGALLATASGDATVKVWDVAGARCAATFTEHASAVWDVAFHSGGDLFASAGMDHTAKVWDLASNRCRQTFRGHVDSVNSVGWQPFGSGLVVTASGDKTVSLWDTRSGLCVQTLYGHANAVSSAAFSAQGDAIVSADADGVVKLWDVRLVGERAHLRSLGGQAVNDAVFDRTGTTVALASDDHTVKLFSAADAKHLVDLQGHEDAVQAVLFDPQGQYIVSAAADHTFRIWS
jgi:WD40 repeat protein